MSATEDAQQAIEANGFHCINDSAVGEQIAEMDRNASQFASSSKAGLEFYKTNVLENEVSQSRRLVDHTLKFAAYPRHTQVSFQTRLRTSALSENGKRSRSHLSTLPESDTRRPTYPTVGEGIAGGIPEIFSCEGVDIFSGGE